MTESQHYTVPPQARFTDEELLSEHVSIDYHAIGVFTTDTDTWIVSGSAGPAHSEKNIEQEHPTRQSAIDAAEDHLSAYSWEYHYIVVVENHTPQDIIYRNGFTAYRVLKSNVEGWVHGFHGDQEYHAGGEKDAIIDGAKEVVVEQGYDQLLIEDEAGNVEEVWVNCFLSMPDAPAESTPNRAQIEPQT